LRKLDNGVLCTAATGAGGMAQADQYVLGHRQAEQERLKQQALQLAGESERLFDQIGLAPSARIVEIGCGPRGCLDLLAHRAGPAGQVIGIERNEDAVALARAFVAERGLSNVEVRQGDARATGLERATFDLVTSRLVLVNIPQPDEVVAEAVALARPGGWVAFHEADFVSHVCDPPLSAWPRLVDLFVAYSAKRHRLVHRPQGSTFAAPGRARGCAGASDHPCIPVWTSAPAHIAGLRREPERTAVS
jgi:SAM-dependent methyltransferase